MKTSKNLFCASTKRTLTIRVRLPCLAGSFVKFYILIAFVIYSYRRSARVVSSNSSAINLNLTLRIKANDTNLTVIEAL